MPIVDMSLEKLKEYQGRNPRPADFDDFWDRSLEELGSIDPSPVFKPASFKSKIAEAFDLTFTSAKGAKIHARFVKPKNITEKAPALLRFHGLSGSASDWNTMLAYASEGFVVAFMDARGQGGYSEDVGGVPGTTYTTPFMRGFDGAPEDLLCRDMFLDTAQLARVIMELDYVDETRVGATGGSQGGALTLACAALVPEIKLAAPVYPYLCDYKRVWEMDLDKGAYEGIRYYLRHFDPRHERIDEFFTKLGYIDLQFLAPRIKAKLLMCTGLMDTTCPPSTQFAAYNKITSEKKMLVYPDYGHEDLKGNSDIIFEFMRELAK
ncbi:MAG: alpha/beta fold hydrolase [Clostridia bacterium]|nr:alpha/beta fold hydrolase [Clostridia bacterium]